MKENLSLYLILPTLRRPWLQFPEKAGLRSYSQTEIMRGGAQTFMALCSSCTSYSTVGIIIPMITRSKLPLNSDFKSSIRSCNARKVAPFNWYGNKPALSKCGPETSGVSKTLSGGWHSRNYLHNNTKTSYAFAQLFSHICTVAFSKGCLTYLHFYSYVKRPLKYSFQLRSAGDQIFFIYFSQNHESQQIEYRIRFETLQLSSIWPDIKSLQM